MHELIGQWALDSCNGSFIPNHFFFNLIVLLVFIKRNIKVIKDKFEMLAKSEKVFSQVPSYTFY
jgi:hypothetical protein